MAAPVYFVASPGSPIGSRTPNRTNQLCWDTANNVMYRSTGLTSSDWVLQGASGITALNTYTPTFSWSGGGTGVTYARQDGNYVTLGGVLTWFTCDIDITLSSVGSASNTGNAQFSLPANSVSTNGEIAFAQVRVVTDAGMDWISSDHIYANIDPNKSFFTLRTQADGVGGIITDSRLVNGQYRFIVNGMYASV